MDWASANREDPNPDRIAGEAAGADACAGASWRQCHVDTTERRRGGRLEHIRIARGPQGRTRLVISATNIRFFLTNRPLAMNGFVSPTMIAVGDAAATKVWTGVGVAFITVPPVGLGLGVGVEATTVPAPITMVSRLKPAPGRGLGHTPATKSPNSSKDPTHPPPPPPQLLIGTVAATNNTTERLQAILNATTLNEEL